MLLTTKKCRIYAACGVSQTPNIDKTKRKERRELGHTALSAAHMVIYPDKPGGDDMVKVRLQGTKEDMEWSEVQ